MASLVDLNNTLRIQNGTQNVLDTEFVSIIDIQALQYLQQNISIFGSNSSQPGQFINKNSTQNSTKNEFLLICYINASTVKEAEDTFNQCKTNFYNSKQTKQANWIIVFQVEQQEKINQTYVPCLDYLKKIQDDDQVQGYLVLSSSYPQPNINPFQQGSQISNITWPPIIAWFNIKNDINKDNDKVIKAIKAASFQGELNESVIIEINHTYKDQCDFLRVFTPLYSINCILIFSFAILFWFYANYKYRNHYKLQRMLTILPLVKSIQFAQSILLYNTCPWLSQSFATYLAVFSDQILSIITKTMFNTFQLILLCTIGFGWNVTFFANLNRKQCGLIVFIGVFFYLLQLIITYTRQVRQVLFNFIFLIVEVLFYFWLSFVIFKQSFASYQALKQILINNIDDLPASYRNCLKLKKDQMYKYTIFLVFFFSVKIFLCFYNIFLILIQLDNDKLDESLKFCISTLDSCLLVFLCVVFRPRKIWPEFYGVDIHTLVNIIRPNQPNQGLNQVLVPIQESVITYSDLIQEFFFLKQKQPEDFQEKIQNYDFDAESPILILNPCDLKKIEYNNKQIFNERSIIDQDNPYSEIYEIKQSDIEKVCNQSMNIAYLDKQQQNRLSKIEKKKEQNNERKSVGRESLIKKSSVRKSQKKVINQIKEETQSNQIQQNFDYLTSSDEEN